MSSEFHTTHWSVVFAAKGGEGGIAGALRDVLSPIHGYLQRTVTTDRTFMYGGRDATDLTHDFFAQVLEGKMFAQVQREGAPFRVYLLGAVRYFLSQVRIRESAKKRGGGSVPTTLPDDPPDSNGFDDLVFDRDWARAMIRRAIRTLEQTQNDQREVTPQEPQETPVKRLLPWIIREMTAESRAKIAAEFGISDVAIKVALHRLRKKFRETIHAQIAETVKDPSEINAELDHLIRALQK